MTKKFKIIVGACALVLAIALNTRHAMNGYGIQDINLQVEALPGEVCFNQFNTRFTMGMPMLIEVRGCDIRCSALITSHAREPMYCR